MPKIRIVSLVPSLTELVCALGLRPWLVGRTGFCIHPADLAEVPKVGGTKDVRLDRVRALARQVAEAWMAQREALGYPLLKQSAAAE